MLVKELQLLKSSEGVKAGLYNEENENLPRRPSRQSRRHSRLDEEGEEEVVISKKRYKYEQPVTFVDHQEESGESEASTEGEEEKGGRVSTLTLIIITDIIINTNIIIIMVIIIFVAAHGHHTYTYTKMVTRRLV